MWVNREEDLQRSRFSSFQKQKEGSRVDSLDMENILNRPLINTTTGLLLRTLELSSVAAFPDAQSLMLLHLLISLSVFPSERVEVQVKQLAVLAAVAKYEEGSEIFH